ncbi:MAG: hypothetical protein VB081_09770, partial [Christensenella sp.]|uniref:hypothetical protein n=1 Tax=Christensenella sp. TaxID=1935934 RepID=UPI002B2144CD
MEQVKKKFKMPSAYVIIFMVLIIVVVLTYFIPVSVRDPQTGDVVYNATFNEEGQIVEDAGPQPQGLWDILMAPVEGFQRASGVGIALLVVGGFLSVMTATGALEAGIGRLLKRLKGGMLIAIMNLAFALMGTVFGFWEEILPFSLVVIPMFVLAGYDVMTGMGVLFVGATVGNMAAVVNPFATGAAVGAIGDPNLTIGSGIVLRIILFAVMYILSTIMLMRYGARVRKNPESSAVAHIEGIKTSVDGEKKELPPMTPVRLASAIIFIVMVAILMIGYIPWESLGGTAASNTVNAIGIGLSQVPVLGDILGAGNATPFGDWGFNEFSVLFFAGALILMVINHMKVDDFIKNFLDGAKDLLGVVLILAIANGIAIVMGS